MMIKKPCVAYMNTSLHNRQHNEIKAATNYIYNLPVIFSFYQLIVYSVKYSNLQMSYFYTQ